MDAKGKEKGILKLDTRPRIVAETRLEPISQASFERSPASPQPSVDRLSVTWADPEPGSMASSVNLFHLPSEPASEVKFSPSAADGSEDEDYSASLSAVLRQRRASVRRSRKGRVRRPSSPFLPDESRPRRRSSVFTTSSGDTAISMEEGQPSVVTQEQIFENIHLHKEVLVSVKQQPLGMRRKLKLVHQAKAYIKRHEGQLQERLAQSKSTRDIYARFNILLNTKWQQLKREAANTSNLLIPWELRIKEIESHFGSVVASYFTFLRWLFWVNLVIAFILLVFVIVPEYLTANPLQDGERKIIMEDEKRNASNLLTLWEFEGILKFSPIFYGYYSNVERPQYRMPLAYFLTGLVVYIYSFVAILRKMAENSRMSKLSEKEDECVFSWKLFTGWDFMIGNAETAHNRIASVILGFKEALLEEAEKKKDLRNWRIISLRVIVNICVVILLAVSAYAVVTVVSRSDDNTKPRNWWNENETTTVVTVISITFPVFFELLGFLEHYHPRKQLRLQLARIMLLNLLNLYSLIFALFSKIEGMSRDLDALKPTLSMNATTFPNSTLNISESLALNVPMVCFEVSISCDPCNIPLTISAKVTSDKISTIETTTFAPQRRLKASLMKLYVIPKNTTTMKVTTISYTSTYKTSLDTQNNLLPQNLIDESDNVETTEDPVTLNKKQLDLLRAQFPDTGNFTEESDEIDETTEDPVALNNKQLEILRSEFRDTENLTEAVDTIDTTTEDIVMLNEKQLEILRAQFPDTSFEESAEEDDEGDVLYSFSDDDDATTETDSSESLTQTSSSSEDASSTDYAFDNLSTEVTNEIIFNTDKNSDSTISVSADYTTPTELSVTDLKDSTASTYYADSSNESTFTDALYNTEIPSTFTNIVTIPYTQVELDSKSTNHAEEIANASSAEIDSTISTFTYNETDMTSDISTITDRMSICPNITFNCTVTCGGMNVTQVFFVSNCTLVEKKCYVKQCRVLYTKTNTTTIDMVYEDKHQRKMYNLTISTKKKLLKLCWETMFGQELVKLTMMDLVFVLLGTLFMDFIRALFVRYMNRCWCWDLEKKFPEYGDFKIAENILHLINNQGMVWMGMFFSPGLVVLNVSKLMIMMYLRSWAVMTCNVPHEVVFRVSKSNNFYLALLLTMLFLCVLPVGYTIVWVKPSWHCGPFSEYDKIYYILTSNIYKILPETLNFALEYIASPAIVIPMLVLLILIIYYLTSLTNSLREANNDLKIQLRRERTEERRKMFQMADTRRRAGSSALDNTPFARWKKALPSYPMSKSIDSDDRKTVTGEESSAPVKAIKKKGNIFAKIVSLALEKSEDPVSDEIPPSPNNGVDETDTDFHETLPKEVLKFKDITIIKPDQKKKNNVEFNPEIKDNLKVKDKDDHSEKRPETRDVKEVPIVEEPKAKPERKQLQRKQTSESTNSKQSDSFGSVIPVITISTTESDDEVLQKKGTKNGKDVKGKDKKSKKSKNGGELKSLRRQSSVDSTNEPKTPKEKKGEEGHKYQYSL